MKGILSTVLRMVSFASVFSFVLSMGGRAMASESVGHDHGHNCPMQSQISSIAFNVQQIVFNHVVPQGISFKVGDENNYAIDMGFLKGTMNMLVKSIEAEGVWIFQKMDLGFAGKQDVQTLIDPNTGKIIKMIVNGKEQTPPETNLEVIDMTEERITVPAGTFDSIHIRAKNTKDKSEINQWANPRDIPIGGMLKQIVPSQFGNVTIVLTSFKKN